jgi:transcriptional regulator with XRE-family HTH domain
VATEDGFSGSEERLSAAESIAVASQPSVGSRVRSLRRSRRLTLREIAGRAGLSESFLSQLERGQTGATVQSLQRIAAALGVEVSDLFSADDTRRPKVIRRDDRHAVAWGKLGRKVLLTPKPFEHLEVVAAELDVGGSTGDLPYTHGDSEELFLVLSGSVELELDGDVTLMEPGDCAHYRSSTPHRVSNVGAQTAEVLYVIGPPSY